MFFLFDCNYDCNCLLILMFNICHYRQSLKLLNIFFIISAKELAYGLEEQGIGARFSAEARRIFLFLKASITALEFKHFF